MPDDPIAEAQEAVKRVKNAAGQAPEAVVPLMQEALEQIATCLDRLAEAKRNLATQQALLDDRLLRVEHNRVFTDFNRLVGTGATLFMRAKNALPARLRHSTENTSAYAKWVAHESAGQLSVEQAREASNTWTHRPRISVILAARNGEKVRECLESLREQAYENWELCVAVDLSCESRISSLCGPIRYVAEDTHDDVQALNTAANLASGEYLSVMQTTGTLSPLALYYVAEVLQQGAADVIYSDEDFPMPNGNGAPIFAGLVPGPAYIMYTWDISLRSAGVFSSIGRLIQRLRRRTPA
jgi:hypothetical protein